MSSNRLKDMNVDFALNQVQKPLTISFVSGKGGVGKSVISFNLGNQIANTNKISINRSQDRNEWLKQFCDEVILFNIKLQQSIVEERIVKFENFKNYIISKENEEME